MSLALTILQHDTTYLFTWQKSGLDAFSRQTAPSVPTTLRLSSVQLDAQQQADLQQAIAAAAQIAQQLAALATATTGRSTSAVKTLERLGRTMFSQLLPPDLQTELRHLPAGAPLLLSTNDTQLPWELLHDDQHFLALHLALGRQLLTTTTARRNPPQIREQRYSLLIGNPTGDLPAAQREIEMLADGLDSLGVETELLINTHATCASVLGELARGHYDLIHYAGHASPGALRLADGWLTADKIHSALRGAPLIFLNACASLQGQQSAHAQASATDTGELHYAGQGVQDLAAAFLLGGAQALIGTLWPIFDEGAQQLALDFYRTLLQGETIGAALQSAREHSRQAPVDTLIWSALALYGDPQWQFVRQSTTYHHATVLVARLPDPPERWQTAASPEMAQQTRRLASQWGQTIHKFGGQVTTVTPSCLVAVFGAPQTLEDDAERALRAALAFLDLCRAAASMAPALGVASGTLLFDPLAEAPLGVPLYLGPALATAQQCATFAQPGEIVATLATRQLATHKFGFSPRLELPEAEPTFSVTPFPVGTPRASAPAIEPHPQPGLVGRNDELATLMATWQKSQRGRGSIVGLVGEAGIGKSRLVQSFRSACAGAPHRWLAATGSLIEKETGYAVVRQLLRALLSIEPDDQREQIAQKINHTLAHLPNRQTWEQAGALLQELLGLRQQHELTREEQEGRRKRQVQLLRILLAQAAKATPLILVLENMEQADAASLELLAQVTEGIQQLPVLMLLIYRPEREHPWLTRHDQFQPLPLTPLDRAAQIHLLQAWLESAELPRNLPALLERTSGNPLFIEEALRSLQEEGVLVREGGQWTLTRAWTDVQLPLTIQRILLARLDRLPAATRRAIQAAAIIGVACTSTLLAAVLGEEALTIETQLTGCDLLDADWTSGAYTIHHPLIQEVVYQQLEATERQRWHRRIANLLAAQPEEATSLATLAYHYERSDDRINAIRYGLQAMQQATAAWANQLALDWANRVLAKIASLAAQPLTPREQAHVAPRDQLIAWQLAALEQKGDTQATLGLNAEAITTYLAVLQQSQAEADFPITQQAALYVKLAEAHLSRSNVDAAWSVIEQGLDLLQGLPCATLGQLIFWQAMVQRRRAQFDEALASSQQAAAILRELQATRYLARAYTLQGILYRRLGRSFYPQAVQALEASLALSKADNYLPGLARASSILGILYENLGQWDETMRCYREGLQASEQSGDERQLATALLDFSELYRQQGQFDAALAHAQQAQQIAATLDFPDIACVAHLNQGWVYLRWQQLADAEAQLQMAEVLLAQHDLSTYRSDLLYAQAELCLAQQTPAVALDKAQDALRWTQQNAVKIGQLHRTLGLSYLAAGDLAAAVQALTHSRELLEVEQNRYENALTLLAWAYYHQQRGESALALVDCTQASEIFTALGAEFDQQRAEALRLQLD